MAEKLTVKLFFFEKIHLTLNLDILQFNYTNSTAFFIINTYRYFIFAILRQPRFTCFYLKMQNKYMYKRIQFFEMHFTPLLSQLFFIVV